MTPAAKKARIESLRNLVENYGRQGKGRDPICMEALEELSRLEHGGLDFQKSLLAIRAAAKQRKFLSYKDIADINGLSWNAARRPLDRHLYELMDYCNRHGWPLLPAIVVHKDNVATGMKNESGLLGFARGAQELGIDPGSNLLRFLRDEQERVFSWAAEV